jgi:hypothetical protein
MVFAIFYAIERRFSVIISRPNCGFWDVEFVKPCPDVYNGRAGFGLTSTPFGMRLMCSEVCPGIIHHKE